MRNSQTRLWAALLLCFTAAAASAEAPPKGLPAGRVTAIEKIVTAEMSRQGIPGLSVAVATGGVLRWTEGYGFSDVENYVPAKTSTVYRLASISKPITAIAVMQLVEQGKIDLDAPVQRYVPDFPRKRWPLTSRRLLGHLGGVRHYRGREFASTRHYTRLRDALKTFENDPLLSEPGAAFHYSTYGFNLLGAVVEGASGERFSEYIRRHIFEPAGMKTTRTDDVFAIIPNRTRGYQRTRAGVLLNCGLADTSNKIPGGGLIGTPADLVRFGIAVLDGVLVKRATLLRMWTPQRLNNGKRTGYGLGWALPDWDGRIVPGHSGGQQGTATMLAIVPEKRIVVAVMANLEGSDIRALVRPIVTLLAE